MEFKTPALINRWDQRGTIIIIVVAGNHRRNVQGKRLSRREVRAWHPPSFTAVIGLWAGLDPQSTLVDAAKNIRCREKS